MKDVLPARLSHAVRLARAGREGLTPEVVGTARPRIFVAGLIGMGAFAIFFAMTASVLHFDDSLSDKKRQALCIFLAQDAFGFAASLVAFVVSAWRRVFGNRTAMITLLAVEVLVCAVISYCMPWAIHLTSGGFPPITWVVPIMILVPLVIPTPPWIAGTTAFASMLTIPLGIGLLERTNRVEATFVDALQLTLSGLVAFGMALVASRVLYTARQIADVGKYRMLGPLDEGGMGSVYRAEHGFLARPAVVKLIRRDKLRSRADRDLMVQRFIREARVTAQLRSPHTVQLFDFGETGEADPHERALFIAMEFLDGINLEHFIYGFAPDGLEARRATHWLLQACDSLGEAHDKLVVHRDVKPKNIMVCRMGRDVDFIKVLDFGLTKTVEEGPEAMLDGSVSTTESAGLTHTGVRMGTPGYMSPEQLRREHVGPASDIYALGCVAYFLMAGRKPFEGSVEELARQHLEAEPPRLAQTARHPIPPGVDAAVLQCLEKNPARRPADVDDLAKQLRAGLDGATWTTDEARSWWNEHVPAS